MFGTQEIILNKKKLVIESLGNFIAHFAPSTRCFIFKSTIQFYIINHKFKT